MPPPAAALLVIKPALSACGATSSGAASALSSLSLSALLGREVHRRLPPWIREDEAYRNLISLRRRRSGGRRRKNEGKAKGRIESRHDEDDHDDVDVEEEQHMATLTAVLAKFQSLVASGRTKLNSQSRGGTLSHVTRLQLHGAILATLQLAGQLRAVAPERRDGWYSSAGPEMSSVLALARRRRRSGRRSARQPHRLSASEDFDRDGAEEDDEDEDEEAEEDDDLDLEMLQEMLRYAVAAYYDDTDVVRNMINDPNAFRDGIPSYRAAAKAAKASAPIHRDEESSGTAGHIWGDFEILQHQRAYVPGEVGHYVAYSPQRRVLLVGVKGTSTLEDLVTDCCGRAVTCRLSGGRDVTQRPDDKTTRTEEASDRRKRNEFYHGGEQESTAVEVESSVGISFNLAASSGSSSGASSLGNEGIEDDGVTVVRHFDEGDTISGDDEDEEGDEYHGGGVELTRAVSRISVRGDGATARVRCHEGVLLSARRLLAQISPLVEERLYPSPEGEGCGTTTTETKAPPPVRVILCGHSLGAGAASLLGLLLRSKHPDALLRHGALRVYAFAPPPVLDRDAASGASAFVTSVVNNSDLIPRCSMANLGIAAELIKAVHGRLVERGLSPTGAKSTAALVSFLSRGMTAPPVVGGKGRGEGYDGMLMTVEEARRAMETARSRLELDDPNHLYVPGRVLLMYEDWSSSSPSPSPCSAATVPSRRGTASQKGVDLKENDDPSSSSEGEHCGDFPSSSPMTMMPADPPTAHTAPVRSVVCDGTADVLRTLDLDLRRMMTDHLTSSYHASLGALVVSKKDSADTDEGPDVEATSAHVPGRI